MPIHRRLGPVPIACLFIVACSVVSTGLASAQPDTVVSRTERRDDVVSRARGAQGVVVATVTDVAPQVVENVHGDLLIVSRTTLAVEEVLKGERSPTLIVDIEGGTLAGVTLEVSDMPSLDPGDRGVFFLEARSARGATLHGRGRGWLRLSAQDVVEESSLAGLTLESLRRDLSQDLGPVSPPVR